jgi:hypothetical protein
VSRAALVLALLVAGCPRGGGPRDDDDAVVIVRADVADAALWVDGRYIGPVGALKGGVAVEPGAHRFEVRHDEHFSHYAELELAPRERRTLEIDLAPVLP